MLCNNLIKLRIGETYLKVKGRPTRLVRVSLPKPYYVHPEIVKEFKTLSSSFSAKPALEIRKEIEERHRRLGIIKRANNAPINNVYLNRVNPLEGQNGW